MEKKRSSKEFNNNVVHFLPTDQDIASPTFHSQGKVYRPKIKTSNEGAKPSSRGVTKPIESNAEAPTKADSAKEDASPDTNLTANAAEKGKVYRPKIKTSNEGAKPSSRGVTKPIESNAEAPKKADSAKEDASPDTNLTANAAEMVPGDGTCQNHSNAEGAPNSSLAKSHLYEICAANHWKPPSFECYKEEGPNHMKLFTFKVFVEMEEATIRILECFSAPRSKKKTAAAHAAEGALWFLKHKGYFPSRRASTITMIQTH
ncbi:endoribonuclease Dicer homolog 1-like isoform X4 [Malania oleifera]|uniref:endoribonuclease Dicer homolog 1-like isoform X4 n=1 Tax=Malania oleifera TaxID=397392 RepID=UPI0025AE9F60|nr:endoribonuclease Dicer homolog 1-like isoform X4 [Malania oleifera]